ncbi:MAG: low specificity L-threonine aldolase [Acidimicrobiales bacterium]
MSSDDHAPRYDFASDNTSGFFPEALEAFVAANDGFVPSYGDDRWTTEATDALRDLFETDVDVYFVFNGTAANSLALASLCRSYHSVVCHRVAHVETDECGAPELFSGGSKLLLADGAAGRIDPSSVEALVTARTDLHYPKPRAVTITQSTELGTVYRPDDIAALGAVCRAHGLRFHLDGARFPNALVSTAATPAALTWQAGVDVMSFGGTKAGMGLGEAVVFFDRELGAEFAWRCKQAGQLASKMRFVAAPWSRVLADGSWLRHAAHANAMAARLAEGLAAVVGVRIVHPVEANAVFASLDDGARAALAAGGWRAYDFVGGGTRFVCSWATTEATVDALVADLAG